MARGVDDLRNRLDRPTAVSQQWPAGTRSERATGALLEGLEPKGFVVVPLDDHLVVGPTGVWLVGCRDFPYALSRGHRGGLWTGWHPIRDVLDETKAAAGTVGRLLDAPVEPVLAVHTAAVPGRHLVHDGVHVVDATRALVALLRDRAPTLDEAEVARLAAVAPTAYGAANGTRRSDAGS